VWRERARTVAPRFVEVHVRTPVEECAARDAKGLYARARAGEVTGLPGADVDYEAPDAPEIVAAGGLDDAAVTRILDSVRAP
jgi:adenylylsulfate kinase